MTHLRIIQNNGVTEEVSSFVILKLYELATSGDLDNTSVLLGRINANVAYENHINYFNPLSGLKPYPDLIVTATEKYINFTDPEVERVLLANNIGDGVGITRTTAAATTGTAPNIFAGTNITSFDEFALFGWTKLYPNTADAGGMFRDCTSLTTIDLDNITNGNDDSARTFQGCTSLLTIKNIHINPRYHWCYGCTSLASVDLSECTSFYESAFNGCTNLTSVVWPTSSFTITHGAFKNCTSLSSANLTNCTRVGSESSTVGGFENCIALTTIIWPTSSFTLGARTFYGCSHLTSADLTNCTAFYNNSFYECSALASVTWPTSSFTCGLTVFQGCSSLTSADLTNLDYTAVRKSMFKNCTSLVSVTLNSNIVTLGQESFRGCSSLTTIDTSNITEIYYLCFYGCTSLLTLNLSNLDFTNSNVLDVFTNNNTNFFTFNGLTNLRTLGITRFPNITTLGLHTFSRCSSLQGELNFPDLTTMSTSSYGGLFNGCSSLTKISLGHITSFSISGSNTYSSRGVCGDCTSLKILDLGDSLQTIYEGGCKGCSALEAVIINVSTPPTISYNNPSLENIFGNSNVNIYVPDAAVSTYLSTSPWSSFSTHILPLNQYNESSILGTTT